MTGELIDRTAPYGFCPRCLVELGKAFERPCFVELRNPVLHYIRRSIHKVADAVDGWEGGAEVTVDYHPKRMRADVVIGGVPLCVDHLEWT